VDRPDTVDENRENDLLQRLAISAEAPEDQLEELLNEVDLWLDSRADDTVRMIGLLSNGWRPLTMILILVPCFEASSSDVDKIPRTQELRTDLGGSSRRYKYTL
jgi:hypothetical protein